MEGNSTPAPERPPSLAEDLGTVAAASIRGDPHAWLLGAALAVSTVAWAQLGTACVWCAAVLIVLLRLPLLPRAALRAGGVAVTCVVVAIAFAALRRERWASAAPWAVFGLAHALIVPWSVAVARALRRRATIWDAEAASARLSIWVQEHPWRTVFGLFLSVSPGTALAIDAHSALFTSSRAGPDARNLSLASALHVGALLLIAAALQGRILRLAEKSIVVLSVVAVPLLVFAAFGAVSGMLNSFVNTALLRLGLVVLMLFLAEYGARFADRHRPAAMHVALAFVFAWAAFAGFAAWRPDEDMLQTMTSPTSQLRVALCGGPYGALLVVLAASELRGRSLLAAAALFGATACLTADALSGADDPSVARAAVGALLCVNDALFVLAARRVRSITVLPAHHVLRADWAVDVPARARAEGRA